METEFTKTEADFTHTRIQIISVVICIKCVINAITRRPRLISSSYFNSYSIFQQFKHSEFALKSFIARKNVDQIKEDQMANTEHARETKPYIRHLHCKVSRRRDQLEEIGNLYTVKPQYSATVFSLKFLAVSRGWQ
jgi:hypothetical protein